MEPPHAVVSAEDIPDLILAACPGLRAEWPEVAEENADTDSPGGRLGYADAAWVVRHLAHRFLAADTSEFDATFDLIEHLIVAGDPYVSTLAVIGYLEGLQMETVTSLGVDPASFRPWLRPTSAKYWDALNRFWELGTPLPDIALD